MSKVVINLQDNTVTVDGTVIPCSRWSLAEEGLAVNITIPADHLEVFAEAEQDIELRPAEKKKSVRDIGF